MLGGSGPKVPHCPEAVDLTYFMGSLVLGGLSRLIRVFRNELPQQSLNVLSKHRESELEKRSAHLLDVSVKMYTLLGMS